MQPEKIKKKLLTFIGLHLIPFGINVLCRSLRIEIKNNEKLENLTASNQNFIAAFWHGKMIAPWYLFKNKNFVSIISQSKDGEILARVLKKWKYRTIRGSSHKGGAEAMESLVENAGGGYSIAITPDGPTGPREKMKAGCVVVSKKTFTPLVLVGVYYAKRKIIKSWDKFEVPLPFSKVNVIFSNPEIISPELNYEETSEKILEKENELIKLNELAMEIY